MLELPNFGHITTSTIHLSHVIKNFAGDIMIRSYDVITFNSKCVYFKKALSSQCSCHHQNCNHLFLKTSKDLKKLKELGFMY